MDLYDMNKAQRGFFYSNNIAVSIMDLQIRVVVVKGFIMGLAWLVAAIEAVQKAIGWHNKV